MQEGPEEVVALRQEILGLLRQQMDILDSAQGLSDEQLRECYMRQTRVQELREKMEAMLAKANEETGADNTENEMPTVPISVESAGSQLSA